MHKCPQNHTSETADFCSVCGMDMTPAPGHDGRVLGIDAEAHVGRGGGPAVTARGIADPHARARAERVREGSSTLGAVRVVEETAHAELTERLGHRQLRIRTITQSVAPISSIARGLS